MSATLVNLGDVAQEQAKYRRARTLYEVSHQTLCFPVWEDATGRAYRSIGRAVSCKYIAFPNSQW